MEKKEKWYFESKYLSFWFGAGFELSYAICGYFDNRPQLNISLFFFHLILKLPFRNKWKNECDCPKWGISYHNQTLWIHKGGKGNMNGGSKWYTINMPWQYNWVRTSYLRKDGSWEHEYKGDNRNLYRSEWNHLWWSEEYPYTYKLKSGNIQERIATVKVEEREWRMCWFKWIKLLPKIQTTIAVTFSDEVGERTGSWKGGTIGCGYDLRKGESPLNCLRRMEKERKFN